MGKIKKILENELIGGTAATDIYPVTSIKAVYDENNVRLDELLNRKLMDLSKLYPDGGDGGGNKYSLTAAINKVYQVYEGAIPVGTTVSFVDLSTEISMMFQYVGGEQLREANWYNITFPDRINISNISIDSDNGNVRQGNTRISSGYVPVKDRAYKLTVDTGYLITSVTYYNNNFDFIPSTGISPSLSTVYIQIPENAKYLRFSIGKSNSSEIGIEEYNLSNFSMVALPKKSWKVDYLHLGGVEGDTGAFRETSLRVRTDYISVPQGLHRLKITIPSSMEITTMVLYNNGVYGEPYVGSGVYNNLSGKYNQIILSFKKVDGSTFSRDDLTAISVDIESYSDKSVIHNQYDYGNTITVTDVLGYGHLKSSNGDITADSRTSSTAFKRTASKKFIEIDGKINNFMKVTVSPEFNYGIYFYDENKTLINNGQTGWSSSDIVDVAVPYNAVYFKFLVKRADDGILSSAYIQAEYNSIKNDVSRVFNQNQNNGLIHIMDIIVPSNPKSCIGETTDVQDNNSEYYANYGILRLPDTYSESGKPTPLIIFCHGYAGHYNQGSTEIAGTSNLEVDYFLKEGFAVMDVDGSVINPSYPHVCSDMAVEAYLQGYNWVIDRFNVEKSVYLAGHSEGGMMAATLTNVGEALPIKATVLFAPANSLVMLMQLHPEHRDIVSDYYGFEGDKPVWSSNRTFTDEEKNYIYSNFDKFRKTGLFWNCVPDITAEEVKELNTNFLQAPTGSETTYYNNKCKFINKNPIKIFHGTADTSCIVGYSEILYRMLKNAGANVELRLMEGVPHTGEDGITAVGNNNVTTIFGEELSGVPTSLIETVKYFRRF